MPSSFSIRYVALLAAMCVGALPVAGQDGLKIEDLSPHRASASGPRFTAVPAAESGLDFVSPLIQDHPLSYLYHSGMTCSGIAAGDVDGDGRVDIYVANGPSRNALFLQGADGRFRNVTAASGQGLDGGDDWASGVSLADVDNDGDLDLFICNYESPNKLFLNNGPTAGGGVSFTEVAAAAGLAVVDSSHAAFFCDYDNDGDLDLYLLTNRVEDPKGTPAEMPIEYNQAGRPNIRPDAERYYALWVYDAQNWGTEPRGRPDFLFRNDGVGSDGVPKFTDVTTQAGISGRGDGLSAVWWDADMDGDCDLYVCNDFISPDCFYRNNGDGTFTNVLSESMAHTTWFSMGSDFGDLDNDGDFDLIVADMAATTHYKSKTTMGAMGGMPLTIANESNPPQYMRNAVHLNEGVILGELRFREAAKLTHLSSSDWTWTVKMQDFDSDGALDVYMTNGVPRSMNDSDVKITQDMLVGHHMWEFFKDGEIRKEENLAWHGHGDGGLHFEPVGKDWGLDHLGASYGAVHCDLDNDGDLDLVVVNLEENLSVYRNDGPNGALVTVTLRGTKTNSHGVGAVVEVFADGKRWVKQLMPSTGYAASNQPILHFGLGEATSIDKLVVHWPGGGVQEYTELPVNKRLAITEVVGGRGVGLAQAIEPGFVPSDALRDAWHQDPAYDDFQVQSLLPHAMSHLGPGMAWGDVDGDGDLDVYLTGGADQAGQLRLRQPDGSFRASNQRAFFDDRAAEGQEPVFVDIDNDGDLDLFVANGSFEFEPGDARAKNALYLNDGRGGFTRAPYDDTIAEFSGSVAAGDFDGDGDADLFIGTRAQKDAYPVAQSSRLLVNDNGTLRDVTERVAPALIKTGLVSSAEWADVTGDGKIDLLLTYEWGPVTVLRNEGGQTLSPYDTGEMATRTGWWNNLALGDVDGDGDLDILATNVGLNTKYKASIDKPIELYYGDFEGTGVYNIVEVKKEGNICYPERGRSCSSRAMPFIAEKFPTYHDFGLATLDQVYGEDKLANATHFTANTFENGVFINDGSGRFAFRALPAIAQVSAGYGCALADLNGDGHLDAAIAQNFYGPQIENPHYRGGCGQVLLGDGRGGFEPVSPRESGFFIRGDMTALTVTDIDGDGAPDLVVATNRGPVYTFLNRMSQGQP